MRVSVVQVFNPPGLCSFIYSGLAAIVFAMMPCIMHVEELMCFAYRIVFIH